jgi:aminobenzoyl-glutamate utilization protein B
MNHNETFETVESLEAELVSLTESLWEQPELGLHETESAELLSSVLATGRSTTSTPSNC